MTCHASNDGESTQGVLVGWSDGTIRPMAPTGDECLTATVITGAIGGRGFQHCSAFTVEYSSQSTITLTPIVMDEGNGSYAPNPVTLPATGGTMTKYRTWFSPAKWKLLAFQVSFTDPTALIFLQGFAVDAKDWGSQQAYRQTCPFVDDGGFGGQV